jgi:hypothetical protein
MSQPHYPSSKRRERRLRFCARCELPLWKASDAHWYWASTIDARAENEAKKFQQSIADQIINAQSRRAQLIRDTITERIAFAKTRSVSLSNQSDTVAREIEDINVLSKRNQIERERAGLANLADSKNDERANR